MIVFFVPCYKKAEAFMLHLLIDQMPYMCNKTADLYVINVSDNKISHIAQIWNNNTM